MSKEQKSRVKYPVSKKRIYSHGEKSLLDLHRRGKIWKGALLVGLYIEKRSHWDKGRSFRIKGIQEIADAIKYSPRHVRRCIDQLKAVGWMQQTSPEGAEYLIFEIYPFGEEARKDRETTAAPLDGSDPLVLLGKGEISRAECVAWHYVNVGWQERLGQTLPQSLSALSDLIGLSARTLWEVFKDESSRLFHRISTTTHATVLKVFPFFFNIEPPEDPNAMSESEIQASYSEVIFKGDIAHYHGEKYLSSGLGYEHYASDHRKWIYVGTRVPDEVKEAFGDRQLAALAT